MTSIAWTLAPRDGALYAHDAKVLYYVMLSCDLENSAYNE